MKPKTNEEIAAEVAALRALKPVGKFSVLTAAAIAVAIEALTEGIDTTADEWHDLSGDAQAMAVEALGWKEGLIKKKPSEGFGGLVQ